MIEFHPPSGDELSVLGRIAAETFGFPEAAFEKVVERVGRNNLRVASNKASVVGGLAIYRLAQWFGGKAIPMAGIALVCVPPEKRATGISRLMMSSLLNELYQDGTPLATLFASTQHAYRNVGFEQAGTWNQYEMDMSQIGHRNFPLPLNQVELDLVNFDNLAHQRAALTNGNVTRTPGLWDRLITPINSAYPMRGYLIGESQTPSGYIIFEQHMGNRFDDRYLFIRDMTALTGDSYQSLAAFLYGHRPIFPKIRFYGASLDPLIATTQEARTKPIFSERWMMRIIHVTRALTLRGYNPHVKASLDFSLSDPLIAENNGRFRLQVEDGSGQITRGGNGEVEMDIRGLASLYSSLFDATTLQQMGKLTGPAAAIHRANTMFAGPQPWMPDKF
ncbi:MAG: GNAT family N-acetyltransferase [Pirellulaceae bacterium]|nr:GNAT family N-acetyltransferase [Pirellulaceae bacterium]